MVTKSETDKAAQPSKCDIVKGVVAFALLPITIPIGIVLAVCAGIWLAPCYDPDEPGL